MNEREKGFIIGVIIISIGLLSLISRFTYIGGFKHIIAAGICFVVGYLFTHSYIKDKRRWWALIVSLLLYFIGFLAVVDLVIDFPDDLAGALFLWLGSAVFGYVYKKNPNNWWAIIPCGILFTLGSIVILDITRLLRTDQEGIVFLLGLSLTFFYLWSQSSDKHVFRWAKYVGAILLLLTLLVYTESEPWLGTEVVFALLLIVVGVYFIARHRRKKVAEHQMKGSKS
jgi:hypothetical protein